MNTQNPLSKPIVVEIVFIVSIWSNLFCQDLAFEFIDILYIIVRCGFHLSPALVGLNFFLTSTDSPSAYKQHLLASHLGTCIRFLPAFISNKKYS